MAKSLLPKHTSSLISAVFLPALPPSEHTKTVPAGAVLNFISENGIITPVLYVTVPSKSTSFVPI